MSTTVKAILAIGLVAFVAACAKKEEEIVYVEPTPIVAEPTYTKY